MMSRILLMNNGFPTSKNPKHSSYIKSIKESLEAAEHQVVLLTMDSNFSGKYHQLFNYVKFYLKILRFDFKPYRYVLINHYGHYALPLFASLSQIKQPVLHWHGEDLFPQKKLFELLFNRAIKVLRSRALHITPSYYFQKQLSQKHKIPFSKISISPSGGIDTYSLIPLADGQQNVECKLIRVGFASGLTDGKGANMVQKFLENSSQLQEESGKTIELNYIFYGKQKEKYDSLFQRFDNAKRWEVMPSDQMVHFYQSIDLLLFPTARKQESLGLVALEAMSCGVPVLASDAYAIPEYIKDGISGERFSPNNFESLKEKFIKMANQIGVYDPRSIIINHYSKESVIKFYNEFFS